MLHCAFILATGFSRTSMYVKPHSSAISSESSSGSTSVPHAKVLNGLDDVESVDDVELRFRHMENARQNAPIVQKLMEEHSFPLGLAQRAIESAKTFPVRYWIVDNSGSMGFPDGQRLCQDSTGCFKVVKSTRWQELTDDIKAVAALSHTIRARTEFYPLNPVGANPPMIITGDSPGEVAAVCAGLGAPGGRTPLAETTERIVDKILTIAPSLLASGEKACVVIATDGKPDNEAAFQRAVERLLKLPVWLVFRLCTNDELVIDYYNELDGQLEAGVEVIDDMYGEALEIAQAGNSWLTYGPPMQVAREFGMKDQIFDLVDQTKLLPSQIKMLCEAILGTPDLPEPEVDLKAFVAAVDEQLALHPKVFDPPSGKMSPWIKTGLLKNEFR
jgi:hypothetical protein